MRLFERLGELFDATDCTGFGAPLIRCAALRPARSAPGVERRPTGGKSAECRRREKRQLRRRPGSETTVAAECKYQSEEQRSVAAE